LLKISSRFGVDPIDDLFLILASCVFQEDYYVDSNDDFIPIRWLAPENLLCSENGVMLRYINKDSNLW
jgi:hypothetical protein